mmetsp:Transcript_80388/g.209363  ORF Transcript_80388/g.209363 Transcript_80388/m.209363 type:complete len:331 (+) Transcript_80388:456-1448(+)
MVMASARVSCSSSASCSASSSMRPSAVSAEDAATSCSLGRSACRRDRGPCGSATCSIGGNWRGFSFGIRDGTPLPSGPARGSAKRSSSVCECLNFKEVGIPVSSKPAKGSEKRASSVAVRVAFKEFPLCRQMFSSTSSGSCVTSWASCQAFPTILGNLEEGGGGGGSIDLDTAPTPSSRAQRSKSSPSKTEWSPEKEEFEEIRLALFFEICSLAQVDFEENRLALSFEWPRMLPKQRKPSLPALLEWLLTRLLMTLLPRLLALRACTSGGSVEAVADTGSQADLALVLAEFGKSSTMSVLIASQMFLAPICRASVISNVGSKPVTTFIGW